MAKFSVEQPTLNIKSSKIIVEMEADSKQEIVDILIAAYGGTEVDCVINEIVNNV